MTDTQELLEAMNFDVMHFDQQYRVIQALTGLCPEAKNCPQVQHWLHQNVKAVTKRGRK